MYLGLGDRVATSVIRWAAKRAQPPSVGSAIMAGHEVWPEWDTQKAIKEGYKVSYILYSVASDLADCVRSVPWRVKKVTKTGVDILDNHELVEMVRSPNVETTFGALMEAVDLYKSLSGNAYLVWSKMSTGDVDLWTLRPDRVTIVPDEKGHIARYDYHTPGSSTPTQYKPEDILHFKFFDPGSDYYGMAPLQAAARLVDTSNQGMLWNFSAMKNRGRPDLVMAPKTHLEPNQHATLLELLQKRVTGAENARSVVIPSEPMDLLQLSLSPVEMDFLAGLGMYEVGVCKVFHVHPEAIGALGATFENKEWAIRAKWEGPVVSRLSEMRAVMNGKFRKPYGTVSPNVARPGDIYLDYDLGQTPIASFQQKEAIDRATKVWACGVPWNQAIATFGLDMEPVEGGDVGYLPVNVLPVGTTRDTGARFTRAIDDGELFWRAVDRKKQGWERGVAVKASELFRKQGKAVAKAVRSGTIDTDSAITSFDSDWRELVSTVVRAVIKDFGDKTIDDLMGRTRDIRAGEWDPWSEEVQKWTENHTAENINYIQSTTQQKIRAAVLDGINDGQSMTKIADTIDNIFIDWAAPSDPAITTYRAMLIARTEVHSAASYGSHEAARQSGVAQEKKWLDSGDERVRDSHISNASAGWIPFDQSYPSGQMHPGEGSAAEVIMCRCVEQFRGSGG